MSETPQAVRRSEPTSFKLLECRGDGCGVVLAGYAAGARYLKLARQLFMRDHKTMVDVLASMQNAYYRSDERREGFVPLCHDINVQRLTCEAHMNKKLVRARPLAHCKIGLKNLAHLARIVPEAYP